MSATLLPSGAVSFVPQEHTICGLCRCSFLTCQCQGINPSNNYIYVGLPPPVPGTSKTQLLFRWCSLVTNSTTMGQFNANAWYKDNVEKLTSAMDQRSQLMTELVGDYVATLPNDSTLSSLAQAVGGRKLRSKSASEQVQAVSAEAQTALQIFQSGDWACLTWIGSMLLQNAFQSSNPEKYRLDDAQLSLIFRCGVGLLSSVMRRGFDGSGWQLAMESDRAPSGTTVVLPSATDRLTK